MRLDVTLHSDKAERFKEIKEEIEERRGYEPSRPEVVGVLMQLYNEEDRRRR